MATPTTVRTKTFNIRFDDDDWARLGRVSEHYALNASGLIRMLLKREDDRIGSPTKSAKKTAKKGTK